VANQQKFHDLKTLSQNGLVTLVGRHPVDAGESREIVTSRPKNVQDTSPAAPAVDTALVTLSAQSTSAARCE
jgi:hypothetical protein